MMDSPVFSTNQLNTGLSFFIFYSINRRLKNIVKYKLYVNIELNWYKWYNNYKRI